MEEYDISWATGHWTRLREDGTIVTISTPSIPDSTYIAVCKVYGFPVQTWKMDK